MGSFAIVPDKQDFDIYRLHINLWCMPRVVSDCFYCEVGLHIAPKAREQLSLLVLLPFTADDDKVFVDLIEQVKSEPIRHLIFGGAVNSHENAVLYDDKPAWFSPCRLTTKKPECNDPAEGFSVWKVEVQLPPQFQPGDSVYCRFRIVVRNLHSTFQWHGGGFARSPRRACLDARINDLRNVRNEKSLRAYDSALPLRECRFFVILPESLTSQAVFPPLHYVRLFEGSIWDKYLSTATSLTGRKRFLIYQWKCGDATTDPSISTRDPFRVFANFEYRRVPASPLALLVLLSLVFLLLQLLFFAFEMQLQDAITHLQPKVILRRAFASLQGGLLATLGLLALLRTLGVPVAPLKWLGSLPLLGRKLRSIEDAIYHMLRRTR